MFGWISRIGDWLATFFAGMLDGLWGAIAGTWNQLADQVGIWTSHTLSEYLRAFAQGCFGVVGYLLDWIGIDTGELVDKIPFAAFSDALVGIATYISPLLSIHPVFSAVLGLTFVTIGTVCFIRLTRLIIGYVWING